MISPCHGPILVIFLQWHLFPLWFSMYRSLVLQSNHTPIIIHNFQGISLLDGFGKPQLSASTTASALSWHVFTFLIFSCHVRVLKRSCFLFLHRLLEESSEVFLPEFGCPMPGWAVQVYTGRTSRNPKWITRLLIAGHWECQWPSHRKRLLGPSSIPIFFETSLQSAENPKHWDFSYTNSGVMGFNGFSGI